MNEHSSSMLLQFAEGLAYYRLHHGEQFSQQTLQTHAGQDIGFYDGDARLAQMGKMLH